MYKYGEKSRNVYKTLHPDLQRVFAEVLTTRDHSLIEGHRSNERQAELLALKKTKVGPGKSRHNTTPSMAVDVIPYPFYQKDWNDRDKFHLFAGYVLAVADRLYAEGRITHRLRWGGDWDKDWETSDNAFDDFPHFELI
jgi:peptidoglycan L-alanyl-D-glutamate endopeptidase CwlK